MNQKINNVVILVLFLAIVAFPSKVFATLPASTNYQLQEFTFGSGGTTNSTSTNFKLNGAAGQVEFGQLSSTNFKTNTGLTFMQTASIPSAPTLTNPASYYNKLKIVLITGGAASDTQFAIAVSPDNFGSTTKYLQADGTLGNSPVWQTYTQWGGSSGTMLIGLAASTTYTTKVKAKQGTFTESGFGPTSQAATIGSTLSLSLSTNAVNLGQLTPGTVVTAGTQVTVTMTTNGTGGGVVYAYGTNGGLLSSSVNDTIQAVSSDLNGAAQGYGVRGVSTTQSVGGPMEIISPYNGSGNTVGIVDTSKRPLFDSTNQPITAGQGVFEIKAKVASTTKAASDYADIITVVGSGTF